MNRAAVFEAARTIRAGGVVAYPTEYCFGIGCLPQDREAVRRVLAIKHRPWYKGLIVIGAAFSQIERFIDSTGRDLLSRPAATWPGPFTWLLPASNCVPTYVRGIHPTIALRLTAHPTAATLCRASASAIVSTSANIAGRPPLRTTAQVNRVLGSLVDFVLDDPVGRADAPTPIRDARSGAVIRAA